MHNLFLQITKQLTDYLFSFGYKYNQNVMKAYVTAELLWFSFWYT